MYHKIEFVRKCTVNFEMAPQQRPEKVVIERGTRLEVEVQPYVVEFDSGFVEVADLLLQNGAATRGVPYRSFVFLD